MDKQILINQIESLLGIQVSDCRLAFGGGNNRVYRVSLINGDEVAVKSYLSMNAANQERLNREYQGLSVLAECGEVAVPRPIAKSVQQGIAVYSWIQGQHVEAVSVEIIDQVVAFVGRLQQYGCAISHDQLVSAKDAMLSLDALIDQVSQRVSKLLAVKGLPDSCAQFIKQALLPTYEAMVQRCRDALIDQGRDSGQVLAPQYRMPNPSDFGLHNTLMTDQGLVFLDFEYFGWDDPVTLVSHFLWHPGMQLSFDEKQQFYRGVLPVFADDAQFRQRLSIFFPLFGLMWTCILLNEFIPEVLERRVVSGKVKKSEIEAVQRRQLGRAMVYLADSKSAVQVFPYAE